MWIYAICVIYFLFLTTKTSSSPRLPDFVVKSSTLGYFHCLRCRCTLILGLDLSPLYPEEYSNISFSLKEILPAHKVSSLHSCSHTGAVCNQRDVLYSHTLRFGLIIQQWGGHEFSFICLVLYVFTCSFLLLTFLILINSVILICTVGCVDPFINSGDGWATSGFCIFSFI